MTTITPMTCCGQECKTPFCPECGKSQDEPCLKLLAHCRRELNRCTKFRSEWERTRGTAVGIKSMNAIARWQGWVDWLEEVIVKSATE